MSTDTKEDDADTKDDIWCRQMDLLIPLKVAVSIRSRGTFQK